MTMQPKQQIELKGITWDHSRGFTPLVATAQRFHELHPHIDIKWVKRSLQKFADAPVRDLAGRFDLLVIDHPCVGAVARSSALLALDDHLSPEFLAHQQQDSVGRSHVSYEYDDKQWALAIDAAAPVCAYRSDLLSHHGGLPITWDDVIVLGRKGLVACPSIPLDAYGNFLNICASMEETIFPDREIVVDRSLGERALEMLRELMEVVADEFFEINPIQTLEKMSKEDRFAYCPFTYGYSNYSRPGFASRLLQFGDVVSIVPGKQSSTMLGGTGLAISSKSANREAAIRYAMFVASPEIQRGLYFECGGQPGSRSAWEDPALNKASSDYFRATLPPLKRAFVRPRYAGYLDFQDQAGELIHAYLRKAGRASAVLDELNALYRKSRRDA
jgi:multiple sugar transport system substrate-binding protein